MKSIVALSALACSSAFVVPPRSGTIPSVAQHVTLRMTEDAAAANGEVEPPEERIPSAATEWKKQQEETTEEKPIKKTFAVVGGGWGGWGAAKALCEADDVEVTLLDALPDPTGKTPFLSKTGKPGKPIKRSLSNDEELIS